MKYSLEILLAINFVLICCVVGCIVKSEREEREKVRFTPEDEECVAKYFPIMEGGDRTYVETKEPEEEPKEEYRRHRPVFVPHISRPSTSCCRPCTPAHAAPHVTCRPCCH